MEVPQCLHDSVLVLTLQMDHVFWEHSCVHDLNKHCGVFYFCVLFLFIQDETDLTLVGLYSVDGLTIVWLPPSSGVQSRSQLLIVFS